MLSTSTVNLVPSNIKEALDLFFYKIETTEGTLSTISANIENLDESTSILSASLAQTNVDLANKVNDSLLGQPNGVATLDENGVLIAQQRPSGILQSRLVWSGTLSVGGTIDVPELLNDTKTEFKYSSFYVLYDNGSIFVSRDNTKTIAQGSLNTCSATQFFNRVWVLSIENGLIKLTTSRSFRYDNAAVGGSPVITNVTAPPIDGLCIIEIV